MSSTGQAIPPGDAIIYARVSSEEQSTGYSLDGQVERATEYARRNRLTVVHTEKVVESAAKDGRKAFNAIVERLQSTPTTKHLIVEKYDRLARNTLDQSTVERLAEEEGKYIHFVQDGYIYHRNSSPSEFLQLGFGGVISTWYSKDLRAKVNKGMESAAAAGRFPHKAPFGYINNPVTKIIEPDPDKAPWIERMIKLSAESRHSIDRIAAILREEGCPYKLNPSTIASRIRNPIYAGRFRWNGRWRDGAHKPLVTWDLHIAAVRGLERLNKPKGRKRDFPYTGLMKCGRCGKAIVFERKKEKYDYARCSRYRECKSRMVRVEKIEDQLPALVSRLKIDEETANWITEKLTEEFEQNREALKARTISTKRRITEIKSFMDKAYEDRLRGHLTPEMWTAKSEAWTQELNQLQSAVSSAETDELESSNAPGNEVLELAKNLTEAFEIASPYERKEILEFLCSNITVTDEKVDYSYASPFELLADTATPSEWGARLVDFRTWLEDSWNSTFKSKLRSLTKSLEPVFAGLKTAEATP